MPDIINELITKEQLKAILLRVSDERIEKYLLPLNKCLNHYNINTPLRIAHFIAQVAHESGSFRYNEEIWSNPKLNAQGVATRGASWQLRYEGRKDLGNTETGDGYRFRGRGLIQLTGRFNYVKYGASLGRDLTSGTNPDLVGEPELAVDAAGWFWNSRKLNTYADRDDVLRITKRINGGTNGLNDRKAFLKRAKTVFNLAQ